MDISVLLSQFADDTTLYLDSKEESFRESANVLVRFASMSGLKIHFDKTMHFGLAQKKIRRLDFYHIRSLSGSTNTEIIPSINYEGKLLEIQKLVFGQSDILHP